VISRYRIMQAHMLLAAFLLPTAIIYFISGALYTLDIKGRVEKQVIELQLERPFAPNLDQLAALAKRELTARKLPLPGGEPALWKRRGAYEFRWNDPALVVTLAAGRDTHSATMTVRERSPLTQIMRIHRAQAGPAFATLNIILVIGLIVIFASGVYMAQSIAKFRRPRLLASFFGLASFLALMLLQ